MRLDKLESSNPALSNEHAFGSMALDAERALDESSRATMSGVIQKTTILVSMAIIAGIVGYWFFGQNPGMLWVGSIAAFVIVLGAGFVMYGKPQLAPFIAPVYALVEGAFLGGVTAIVESVLAGMEIKVPGGVAFQALLITGCVAVAMLVIYRTRIIDVNRTFVTVLSAATMGIMLTYLLSFVLSFFFSFNLPFVSFGSIFATGTAGLIGLGVNILILIVASLWLLVDFRQVESLVSVESPKYMEWYCGFSLLVTLAWIYYEAVKLVARLAVLFGNRD